MKINEILKEEAYDLIRDYMAMGYSRAEAEAEARRRYPGEFDASRKSYNRRPAKAKVEKYYFYRVPSNKEQDAKAAGLRQTKSGKWFSPDMPSITAEKEFGKGRVWQPKKESMDETTSAGEVAAVATPIGGNKMQKRNPDGTAKNALDGDKLMAGKKKKPKNKKA